MPLTRPRNKSSSRSPGISSANYFQSGSTPKGFHPPSYYAAAAGLTHPHPDDDKPSETLNPRTTTAEMPVTDFDDSFVLAPMPTAQLSVSSSASSTEPSIVSRMSFLNRRLSKGNGLGSKSSSKRKSQLADLPLVEAQLVPSLRDTIDKMTNSPNSQTQSPSNPLSQDTRAALPLPSQYPPIPSTPPARQHRQTGPFKTAHSPPSSTPRGLLESSRIPTPAPVAKSKLNLKPALKNAVTTSSTANLGHGSQSSPTKASPSKSFRSVKAIIGRKTPQIPTEPVPSNGTHVIAGDLSGSAIGSSRLARERSRTDPGHVSRIPSRSPRVPATPRVPPPVSTVSTPGRANHGTPLNRRYAAISDSSGSELNLQGERGRALFVTNAVIVPSSSSSSEDIEESQLVPNADLQARLSYIAQRDYPCDRKLTQSGVGLGLGPAARMSNTPSQSHSHAVPPPSSSGLEADIDNEHDFGLVDEDAATLAISSSSSSAYLRPLMSNPRTLPNLTRNISTSTGGTLPNPWGHDDVQPSESDQRRRELIELVNEMDHGSLGSTQPYEYDGHSDDEYAGEQGLAISPSDNFGPNADTPLVRGGGDDLRHRSPASGRSQATPRQPATRVALGCGNSECSSPGKLLGRVYMQSAEAHKKDQEAEFSPLSEYSDDEDAQYGTNNNNTAESPPFHRNHRGPLRQDLFRSDHEGDYPWSSLDSSNRTSTVSPAHPTSIHRRRYRSGTAGWSENARRTSRGSPVASPSTANVHGAYGPDRTRSVSRVRERNGTQQRSARTLNLAFPHVDSTSSTSTNTSNVRWRSEEQDINIHGEVNLEQLGPSRQSATINSQWQEGRKPSTIHPTKSPAPREAPESHSQPAADQPESHNTQRVYGGANAVPLPQHDRRDSQISAPEQRTWFSTISSSAYHSLLGRYGEVEMERQQVIWDLCETERAFVRRLRTFVQLFIRPLRMKDSVTWLAGVPPEVARLFDWLEDIINIHAQISSALRAIVAEQYPIVMQIAGKIRSFVSYLEVHQPYVVRLESVALLIKRLTEEPGSDFGEFIRIQQEQEECRGWSVESFLVEPVNRLVDYPIHFRRLLDVTPRDHLDHLATFSLFHCTEAVIRVMREVKLQEEEYELVKERLGHIKDLPASLQLAHRFRRLLARGRLERERPRVKARTAASAGPLYEHEGLNLNLAAGVRQSRLINAIQSRAMRSDSIKTTSESTTSMESHFFDSVPSPPYPSESIPRSESTSSITRQNPWDNQFFAQRNEHVGSGSRGQLTQTLYTLVFNDIVLFTEPTNDANSHHHPSAQGDSWRLLERIGISRVFKVREDAGQVVLDLLPVDTDNGITGVVPDSGQLITLILSIPSTTSSGVRLDMSSVSRLRQNWISAFQECADHTIRALSFPTQSGKLVATLPGLRWDVDSQASVSAILESGLPLPKSPSTQMAERSADPSEQEREARGWWALRFQQVFREMQRGSTASLITVSPGMSTPRGDTLGKLPRSQPRVPKLSSFSSYESMSNRLA